MPDRRIHRGPAPRDRSLFDREAIASLREAASDLVWLLNRGYTAGAAVKLVGDRHRLRSRQRAALLRAVCSDAALERRMRSCVEPATVAGASLLLDGFNVLTTVEAALGGALLLRCRDGCYRDLVGAHGNYRRVSETVPAAVCVGDWLSGAGPSECRWLLDAPVSNSGRLKGILEGIAGDRGWPWTVGLDFNPDRLLRESSCVVATADGEILESGVRWVNLVREVVDSLVAGAWVVDLFGEPD